MVLAGLPATVGAEPAPPPPTDATLQSAIYLLRSAYRPASKGGLLVSLAIQQIGDAQFVPLYEEMARSDNPAIVVQGHLGLVRAYPRHEVNVDQFLAISNPAVQVEILTEAIEEELLTNDQARELMGRTELQLPVKLVLAANLIEDGGQVDPGVIEQGLASDNVALKGLAALVMLQMGNDEALGRLEELSQLAVPQRDLVQIMLLKVALRHEFGRAGAWALRLIAQGEMDEKVVYLALRAALRFGQPAQPAIDAWTHLYRKTTDAADRMRLALVALQVSPWADPVLYVPMLTDDQALIQKIGRAGQAVASKSPAVEPLVQLIEEDYLPTDQWVIAYARDHATPQEAEEILTHTITSMSPQRLNSTAAVDLLASAAEVLHNRCPEAAGGVLGPLLTSPQSSAWIARGILYGLLRCPPEQRPHRVLPSAEPLADPDANRLALLLLAKSDAPLTGQQTEELGLIVRGGGALPDALRLQAAWAYLRRTDQLPQAVGLAVAR